jgi:serine/threonine protein kinase
MKFLQGTYGKIILAKFKNSSEKCVIKVINKVNFTDVELKLTRSEIEILRVCNNPFIVDFIDAFENQINIYINLVYVAGCNLFDFIQKMKI